MPLGPTYFDGSTYFNDSDRVIEQTTSMVEGSLNNANWTALGALATDLANGVGAFVRAADTTYSPRYLRATVKIAGSNAVQVPLGPTPVGTFYYAAYVRVERRVNAMGNPVYYAVFVGTKFNTGNGAYSVSVAESNIP